MRFLFAVLVACLWPLSARAGETPRYGNAPAWVRDIAIPKSDPDASGPAELLLQDIQIHFDASGRHLYTRTVVRIRNNAGLSAFGNLAFVWNPALEDLAVHRIAILRGNQTLDLLEGGKSITVLRREENLEEAKLDGALTASLQPSGLQINDFLEIATTITHLDPNFQGQDEIATGNLLASGIGRLHVRADWPAARPFRWRTTPGMPAARPFDAGPTKGVWIEADHVEPLQLPDNAPNRYYQIGSIEVTEFPSYGAISALLFPLFSKAAKLNPDPELDAAISKIKAENTSIAARTLAALRLVQEQVRYVYVGIGQGGYVPTDANDTWKRRFGDCKGKTALLIAILGRLGVPAEAALVQTVNGEGLETRLPLAQSFDHVLVRVDLEGKTRWIDPTRFGDRSLEPDPGPGYYWALPLRAEGGELERLPNTPQTQPLIESIVEMDARDGMTLPVKLEARTIIRGDVAVTMNLTFDSLNQNQRTDSLREYWKNEQDWEKIESVNFAFDPQKREAMFLAKGLVKIATYAGKNGGTQFTLSGGDIGWNKTLEREDGPNAKTPFKVGYPYFISTTQSIALPYDGFGFSLEADDINQTIGPWHFERTSSKTEGTFKLTVTTQSLSSELPAAQAKSVSEQIAALAKKRARIQIVANLGLTSAEIAALKDISPASEDEQLNRAYQYMKAGKYEEALADFNTVISKNPKSAPALANRAILYVDIKQIDKAKKDASDALVIDPNNWVAHNANGRIAVAEKNFIKAVDDFSKSHYANPDNDYSLQSRALCYYLLKDYPKAIADYEVLRNSFPDNLNLLIRLAQAMVLNGQIDQGLALMDTRVEASKADAEEFEHAIMARVQVAIAGKLSERALADADTLLAQDRNSVPLLTFRCQTLGTLGERLQTALADCQKALKLDPSYDEALVARAIVYLKLTMPKLAQADFQSALRLKPNWSLARLGLGMSKLMQGKDNSAQDLQTARASDPFVDATWKELGLKLEAQTSTP